MGNNHESEKLGQILDKLSASKPLTEEERTYARIIRALSRSQHPPQRLDPLKSRRLKSELLAEYARLYPQKRRGTFLKVFTSPMLSYAFAFCFIALVGFGIFNQLGRSPSNFTSMSEESLSIPNDGGEDSSTVKNTETESPKVVPNQKAKTPQVDKDSESQNPSRVGTPSESMNGAAQPSAAHDILGGMKAEEPAGNDTVDSASSTDQQRISDMAETKKDTDFKSVPPADSRNGARSNISFGDKASVQSSIRGDELPVDNLIVRRLEALLLLILAACGIPLILGGYLVMSSGNDVARRDRGKRMLRGSMIVIGVVIVIAVAIEALLRIVFG